MTIGKMLCSVLLVLCFTALSPASGAEPRGTKASEALDGALIGLVETCGRYVVDLLGDIFHREPDRQNAPQPDPAEQRKDAPQAPKDPGTTAEFGGGGEPIG